MNLRLLSLWVNPMVLSVAMGCILAQVQCRSHAATAKAKPSAYLLPSVPVSADELPAEVAHGTRKLLNADVPVFVDGQQRGVLRFGELAKLQATGVEVAPRFRFNEYLATLGVDVAKIRAVHLHDSHTRIASIEAAELRKEPERFLFRFMAGKTGKVATSYATTGLKNTFIVHEIRAVSVFVEKPVPAFLQGKICHTEDQKTCSEKVPYAGPDLAKGTRLYLDGKMVGYVRRKLLDPSLIAEVDSSGSEPKPRYSLQRLAQTLAQQDLKGVKTVYLMAGDELVGRGDASAFGDGKLLFAVVPHAHGKVEMVVPLEMQAPLPQGAVAKGRAKESAAPVVISAVLLFRQSEPPPRDLVPLNQAVEAGATLARQGGAPDPEGD
jgi:hypothetical protein